MDDCTCEHMALINDLLAEKDRLISEKDDICDSKYRMWRELHQMLQEKDAEIAALRSNQYILTQPDRSNASAEVEHLRDQVQPLRGQLRASQDSPQETAEEEEADEENEDEADEYAYLEDGGAMTNGDGKSKPVVKREASSTPTSTPPTLHRGKTPQPNTRFIFAPLISVQDDGSYEFGRIDGVAAPVLRSIHDQLQHLHTRQQQGKSGPCPSTQYRSTGCMWTWIYKSSHATRWTLENPRVYACGSCFSARRACLFWLGHMKWMILPLPPAVRDGEATWEDACYYIYQGANETSLHFPGVWLVAKTSVKRERRLE